MNTEPPLKGPFPLVPEYDGTSFDCGIEPLNTYLKQYALQNHRNGSSKAYVALRGNQIVGYYTLSYGSVSPEEATVRVSKGLGRYPVPIMLLGRLAVDQQEKGKGLGKGLLVDALLRTVQASEIAGLRAILVHVKDENAKQFYLKYGFEPSPIQNNQLFLLIKDLKKILTEHKKPKKGDK